MPPSVYKKMRFLWLSFHLSQCTAPATSPGLASVNGCKEIEEVKKKGGGQNHSESEISRPPWTPGWRRGGRLEGGREKVKSHCFHQSPAAKPLRDF